MGGRIGQHRYGQRRHGKYRRRPKHSALTMRLSDAGLHQRQTKALYPHHLPPPWLTEDATRDRSNRLLGIVRGNVDSTAREFEATHDLVRRHHLKYTIGLASTIQYPN
jgi:hypothetical protein